MPDATRLEMPKNPQTTEQYLLCAAIAAERESPGTVLSFVLRNGGSATRYGYLDPREGFTSSADAAQFPAVCGPHGE